MEQLTLHQKCCYGARFLLENQKLFKISGTDAKRFLQGQMTADIDTLETPKHAILSSLLNLQGKVECFFWIYREDDLYTVFVSSEQSKNFTQRLEKFIIMDDVEIESTEIGDFHVFLGAKGIFAEKRDDSFYANFFGLPARISKTSDSSCEQLSQSELNLLHWLCGWPVWGENVSPDEFVNETILDPQAISYSKGCFLGQETAAKIHNGRGPSNYPVVLELGSDGLTASAESTPFFIGGKKAGCISHCFEYRGVQYATAKIFRNYRVEESIHQIEIEGENHQIKVRSLPLVKEIRDLSEFGQYLFELASLIFTVKDNRLLAKEILEYALMANPRDANSFEALGVIYGKEKDFHKGIELMDRLLEVDPESVLAHTNKSLFLMNLGKIEEAEAEKAQATLKSFAMYGKDAQTAKEKELRELEEKESREKRRQMFMQVLELDPNDEMANCGLGEIALIDGEPEKACEYFQNIIRTNEKYSQAYMGLGEALIAMNEWEDAKSVLTTGIGIAAEKGELMPAGKMQAKLKSLNENGVVS